jgi:hypothetical protein
MSKTLDASVNFAAYLRTEAVELPELDCVVILRQLNAGQSLSLEKHDLIPMLAMMIIDENGNRVFTTPAHLENLGNMSAQTFGRLIEVAARLNGATQEALETTVKN